MSFPILGVLADPAPAPDARRLLRALTWWCEPRSTARAEGASALFATSPRAAGLDSALAEGTRPVAVVIGPDDDGTSARTMGAVLVATRPESALDDAITLPTPGIDGAEYPPMAPAARRRWRRRLGFDESWVLSARPGDALPTTHDPCHLALCSVAIAAGQLALVATALATPLITDTVTATNLGLEHGRNALVIDDEDAARARAIELAVDPESAALAQRAHEHFRHHHDISRTAQLLAHRLGLTNATDPAAVVRARCAELGTSPRSKLADALVARSVP